MIVLRVFKLNMIKISLTEHVRPYAISSKVATVKFSENCKYAGHVTPPMDCEGMLCLLRIITNFPFLYCEHTVLELHKYKK